MSTFRISLNLKNLAHGVICFFAFLLLAQNAWAASGPRLVFSNGFEKISRLEIGQSLGVKIYGAQGATSYNLVLLDSAGNTVRSTPVTSNTFGRVDLTLLWSEQQMVPGCNAATNLGPYEYVYHADAEAALSGTSFRVELRDSTGQQVAYRRLPITTGTGSHVFFSGPTGCPQYEFDDTENVYLTARRLNNSTTELRKLWLIDTIPGAPSNLQDIRSLHSGGQLVVLTAGVSEQTFPVLDFVAKEECTMGYLQAPQGPQPPPPPPPGGTLFDVDAFASPASKPHSGPAPVNQGPCPPCGF